MKPPHQEVENLFDRQLVAEILATELTRIKILGLIFAILLPVFAIVTAIPGTTPESFSEVLLGGLSFRNWLIIIQISIIGYCALMWLVMKKFAADNPLLLHTLRYLNAFVETCIPTAGILLLAQLKPPVHALLAPPSFMYFVFILLATLRLDFKICLFTGAVAACGYLILAMIFVHMDAGAPQNMLSSPAHHLIKAVILFVVGAISGLVTLQIRKRVVNLAQEIKKREQVVSIFGQHVSPAVVNKLLQQRKGDVCEVSYVCVMFLDIRNFTSFSERREPEDVVHFLNGLLDKMVDIINHNNGIINKFLGDGFMALFGAPIDEGNAAANAVAAAREIITDLQANADFQETRVGIGLHIGNAVVGNVGSSMRKEYTVIGDVVNLASRIEQLNKQFSSQLLISEEVLKASQIDESEAEFLGAHQVKGRENLVNLYKLV